MDPIELSPQGWEILSRLQALLDHTHGVTEDLQRRFAPTNATEAALITSTPTLGDPPTEEFCNIQPDITGNHMCTTPRFTDGILDEPADEPAYISESPSIDTNLDTDAFVTESPEIIHHAEVMPLKLLLESWPVSTDNSSLKLNSEPLETTSGEIQTTGAGGDSKRIPKKRKSIATGTLESKDCDRPQRRNKNRRSANQGDMKVTTTNPPKGQYKCQKCNEYGHNARTCHARSIAKQENKDFPE